MSKSSNVFNLVDGLLPQVAAIDIRQPGLLQMLYAGIGMPSLRIEEMATQGCVTYCQIKAGNRLRSLYDRMPYVSITRCCARKPSLVMPMR